MAILLLTLMLAFGIAATLTGLRGLFKGDGVAGSLGQILCGAWILYFALGWLGVYFG